MAMPPRPPPKRQRNSRRLNESAFINRALVHKQKFVAVQNDPACVCHAVLGCVSFELLELLAFRLASKRKFEEREDLLIQLAGFRETCCQQLTLMEDKAVVPHGKRLKRGGRDTSDGCELGCIRTIQSVHEGIGHRAIDEAIDTAAIVCR